MKLRLCLPLLTACGMTEENFAEKMAELTCEAYATCGIDVSSTCELDSEQYWLDLVKSSDCEYDPQAARECYSEASKVQPENREGCRVAEGIEECALICGTSSDSGS
jgi:hypothetical protein